ncbi:MAG: hypothetical protein KH050_04825 [Clostridiaceae bacterium]|nr:hypothetical protein [Clostridiaceae bacterium]
MNYGIMNHVVNHLLDVDSYGCLFMYATHQDLTTAPRHIIRMTEPVDPELLREALKIALLRFPQMGLGLVRGRTQYQYRLITEPPVVLPFEDISPYYIGSEDQMDICSAAAIGAIPFISNISTAQVMDEGLMNSSNAYCFTI